MKRIIIISVLAALPAGMLVAQSIDPANIPSPSTKPDKFPVKFGNGTSGENFVLPFSHIEIVDARHDSSKLGFHRPRFSKRAAVFTTDSGHRQQYEVEF